MKHRLCKAVKWSLKHFLKLFLYKFVSTFSDSLTLEEKLAVTIILTLSDTERTIVFKEME
jgi:hypothetical protein